MVASAPIIPLDQLNPANVIFDKEAILEANPHRFEMQLLDSIIFLDEEQGNIAGVRNVGHEEFWSRGHFPGNPILPGVLMMETAGQLCSFYSEQVVKHGRIMVFAAADNVKFRGMARPGEELLILGKMISMRRTATKFLAQAWCKDKLIIELGITGMLIEPK